MPELRVEAVIFDMDGVVIDSGAVYERHWRRWGEEHGVPWSRIAVVHPGRPPVETIRTVAPHLDAEAEAERYLEQLHATDPSAAGGMPGARDLLSAIPAGRWGIATSAPRRLAPGWIAEAGLPAPTVLVTADDVERGKPAPDPYLRAAELLGFDVARCLVIEDAPAGISAAKAAGATVLGLWTTHAPRDLDEADHQARDLTVVRVTADADALQVSWPAPD